ncbi:MAG: ABC transporter ATP-binding protein [Lachnospiraceae bacterium]|nr:ABC transporter ATP-binding protein [Lachnospiraceae bacterium]
MTNIIEMKNIHKFYKNGTESLEALKGVSFALKQGEILAIMGSSGSGKSTLLHIIGAMDTADEGEIYLNETLEENYGVEPDATKIRYENIGFIFQDFKLIQDFTVEENVSLPLLLAGEKSKEIRRRTKEILGLVGLEDKGRNPVTKLSGGQRQRVAIARALINHPKILLADEPTGNLDCNTAYELMQIFLDLKEKEGQSIILVTHDPTIASYADRILFLQDGRIYGEYEKQAGKGNVDEILAKFRESQKVADMEKGQEND